MFRIVKDFPPNIEKIRSTFNIDGKDVCFAYGDTLYNPTKNNIRPDLMEHEMTHQKQQLSLGVEAWWDRYLSDPQFRLEQELEAYRAQFKFFRMRNNATLVEKLLRHIALDLSSEIYGNIIDYDKARELISRQDTTLNAQN